MFELIAGRRLPLLLVVVILLVAGCASAPERSGYHATGVFPEPPEIADNVAFWRNVYASWSRGDVAIHDNEHLGVVYEVARLPGPVREGYTPEQRDFVQARRSYHQRRLTELEVKHASGQRLTRDERELRDQLVSAGGPNAIAGASERVRVQRGLRERFHRGLEISGRYDTIFRDIMRTHGVPEDLAYLPHVESSFQLNARSSVGAAGVWQFMPATGREYMRVTSAVDERLDPVLAADAAARYLRNAHHRLGSWPLAVTSYNHGVGGMLNARAQFGDDFGAIARHYRGRAFGFSSRNFYASFLAAREVASQPHRYFPEGVRFAQPLQEDRLILRRDLLATDVARHYGVSVPQLADLNLAWRDPVRNGQATLPAGSTVWLPRGALHRVAGHPEPRAILVAQTTPRPVSSPSPAARPPASRPAPAAVRHHVVQPNENLFRVALRYELSVDELRRLNQMAPDDNRIRVGQRLRISG